MAKVVLVDKKDRALGLKGKFETHRIPVPLHRAISIIIFSRDKSKMLITKRSKEKQTWPYYWSNAVCSHPYPKETYQKAAERRLYEELGFQTPLKEVFNLTYEAQMSSGIWGEHELDHVFVGIYSGRVGADSKEVAKYEWIEIDKLNKDLKENPNKYTPWFKIILKKLKV